jgi:ribosomal protein S27E
MSRVGKIAKCSECRKEKTIFYEDFNESLQSKRLYCKECFDYGKEKVKCAQCGQEVIRGVYAEHVTDMHRE